MTPRPVVALSRRLVMLSLTLIAALWCSASTQAPVPAGFANRIAALSESEGYFDTDNLISNERAYLTVLGDLARAGVRGGAYVGVGPDQNFSYIAAIRPSLVIITDIRRDNLLLHLLFKALFAESATRIDYLAQLTGRRPPAEPAAWRERGITALAAYIDAAPAGEAVAIARLRARLIARLRSFGVPLSTEDVATLDRFHREFIDAGLGLRFRSTGRAPQAGYPTLRDLLLARDDTGVQANYLATESDFQFLKDLQARDLIVPIVGDLSGPSALRRVGVLLRERQERLSALYASNVEFYLARNGTFDAFVENLRALPRHEQAVIIRSVFSGGGGSYSKTQRVTELVDGYARGQFHQYFELTR